MRSFRAKFAGGDCPLCSKPVRKGELVTKGAAVDDGGIAEEAYQHLGCAQQARQKHLIAQGYTFAAQKPSDYGRRRRPDGPRS